MTGRDAPFPQFRAVADHAVLVEFGDTIGPDVHDRVLQLDAALAAQPFEGFTEAVPAYTNVLVGFDPLVIDHKGVGRAVRRLLEDVAFHKPTSATHEVLACYDDDFGPDLDAVSVATGLQREAVIAAHLSGRYTVFMYGFAPGYAYLAGVPEEIQRPRKPSAIRGISAGSIIVAGPQCLVTTLTMPTGWWIIGRSPTRILRDDIERPFLFDVGDTVTFRRVGRDMFDAAAREA